MSPKDHSPAEQAAAAHWRLQMKLHTVQGCTPENRLATAMAAEAAERVVADTAQLTGWIANCTTEGSGSS